MGFAYETYGPFDLDRDGNKLRRAALTKFWKERAKDAPLLNNAIGVYIVGVRASKSSSIKPWYVGKTDKQGFKKRFYQQIGRFSDVLDFAKNGEVKIFLIARYQARRPLPMKPRSAPVKANDELETLMIASCLKKNSRLINASKVKHQKEIQVPGYMNERVGKRSSAATELNRTVKGK
jgi:hypothetical protein